MIGIVTSSAVPRTPSGPALMRSIDVALKWVQIDVLAGRDRELSTPLFRLVITWPAVGDVTVDRGCRVVDDERRLGVGIGGIGLVAALVDDPDPGHVVTAVGAGQGRKDAAGPDIIGARTGWAERSCRSRGPCWPRRTPTVTANAPPVVVVAVPAFGRMNWARLAGAPVVLK